MTTPETKGPTMTNPRRQWHWEWNINMPFCVRLNWWHDERISIPRGLNLWLGWRRLNVWQTRAVERSNPK